MALKKIISNYASFNEWANIIIADWLLKQDVEKMNQEVASSFKTMAATVHHILRTQQFWYKFLIGDELDSHQWSVRKIDITATLLELKAQSTLMKNTFSTMSEKQLSEKLILEMPWAKGTCERYEYILHVINHSTFHRGQLITIARILGLKKIPNTDLNIYNIGRQ